MTILAGRLSGPLLALALLTACSGNLREVIGEPPQVSLDGLEKHDTSVTVELAIRNVNDDPLLLSRASVELLLDGHPLAAGGRDLALTVSARGREVIRLPLPADPNGLESLQRLADTQAQRLPWTLQARLVLDSGRNRSSNAEGWLYPVPGQPDRFR